MSYNAVLQAELGTTSIVSDFCLMKLHIFIVVNQYTSKIVADGDIGAPRAKFVLIHS